MDNYRTFNSCAPRHEKGCGCGNSGCCGDSCGGGCGCHSCCNGNSAGVKLPNLMRERRESSCGSSTVDKTCSSHPSKWEEYAVYDFAPEWDGEIINGKVEGGKLVQTTDEPVVFISKPIDLTEFDAYKFVTSVSEGAGIKVRVAASKDNLKDQTYMTQGIQRNFRYAQVMITRGN